MFVVGLVDLRVVCCGDSYSCFVICICWILGGMWEFELMGVGYYLCGLWVGCCRCFVIDGCCVIVSCGMAVC